MVDLNRVDEAHRSTWQATVRMTRNSVIAVVLTLVLMAVFLL
ncbi:MAG: aa3-type cytochrome c oxidase subunit IV [Alphaproteobacteria bacterium]